MARSLRGSGGTDDLVLLNIESQGRGVPHVHALSSEGSAEYLLKYLCKGAGSAMTAADEKYDDDVEMLDAFDHEELISMLADVLQGVDVD
jgi:hypothetical protein